MSHDHVTGLDVEPTAASGAAPAGAARPEMSGKRTRTGRLGPSLDHLAERVSTVLQRRAVRDSDGVVGDAEDAVAAAARSTGQPLPVATRAQFEASLGTDLSRVRVHTGAASDTAAHAVGAEAYTVGADIHFGAGRYQPDDPFGMHLLAHEVAHTVQQAGGTPHRQHKLAVSGPTDGAELEADRAADAMVRGAPAQVTSATGLARQRKRDDDDGAEVPPEPPAVVPPAERSLPPPQPRDWSQTAPLRASPTVAWWGGPQFKPAFTAAGNLEEYRRAFTGSWGEAQRSYASLYALHHAYEAKGKELVPILRIAGTSVVGAEGAHVNATASFDGAKLRPAVGKIDADKIKPELRAQIEAAKETVAAKRTAITNGRDEVATAADLVTTASNTVEKKTNDFLLVKVDKAIADLNLDAAQVKRDFDEFKATSALAVESAKAVADFANCFSDPSKLFGNAVGFAKQGATTVGAAANLDATLELNQKLSSIDGQIRNLTAQKEKLQTINAGLEVKSAIAAMSIAVRALHKAVRAMQTAKDEYGKAFRDLSQLIQKAGGASNMSAKDQAALAGAVEAMPKLEDIIATIAGMQVGLVIPPYNDAAGVGAAMASNADEFVHCLALLKGNRDYVDGEKTLWEGRKASVEAVIAGVTAVPGADW